MRSLNYDKRKAAKTDLFDLIKINNVSSNVNQPEPGETNKMEKVVRRVPYTSNNQKHSLGTKLIFCYLSH